MKIASSGLCILLLIVFVALRVVSIGQYPEVHPDEGYWAGGARDYALYGDGLMSGRLHPFLCPGHFCLLAGFFLGVRPNLLSARLFNTCVGILSCLLIVLIARRCFPRRWWLFPFLFGLSSLVVNIHQMALLEAHQMFWLVLAATVWLNQGRFASIGSGAALGMALLVKSNGIYILPAFLITSPCILKEASPRSVASRGVHALIFLLTLGLVVGGGYLTAWAMNPEAFTAAFRFELDGKHFLTGDELFHFGRFGLNPSRAIGTLKAFIFSDPLLVILALLGVIMILRNFKEASRADLFFSVWAVCGVAFILSQILVAHRYLTTVAPALAYLATRVLDRLLTRIETIRSEQWSRYATLGLVLLFCGYHISRLAAGIVHRPNAGYWSAVSWVEENIPHETNVLAAPHLGLSLPQRSYDFYRTIFAYDGTTRLLEEVVVRYNIGAVIVDGEWREYQTSDMTKFLAEHCTKAISLPGKTGQEIEIYLVMKNGR